MKKEKMDASVSAKEITVRDLEALGPNAHQKRWWSFPTMSQKV
jgi:hypothetical protein